MLRVMLRCSSFCGVMTTANLQPLFAILLKTRPTGTSSFGNSKSTFNPTLLNFCSIYSAYSLKKKKNQNQSPEQAFQHLTSGFCCKLLSHNRWPDPWAYYLTNDSAGTYFVLENESVHGLCQQSVNVLALPVVLSVALV